MYLQVKRDDHCWICGSVLCRLQSSWWLSSGPCAYWDDMKCRYPGIDLPSINRMLLGCSIDRDVINSERLSKLTGDLWEQLHVDVLPEEFLCR